jgi:hypothetical protein
MLLVVAQCELNRHATHVLVVGSQYGAVLLQSFSDVQPVCTGGASICGVVIGVSPPHAASASETPTRRVYPTGLFWHKAAGIDEVREVVVNPLSPASWGREHLYMRWWWTALVLAGCLGDQDPPELVDWQPADGADLRGIADVSSWAIYRDDSDVEARLFIDAELVAAGENTCAKSSCRADFVWSTLDFAPGPHDLTVSLEDAAGNVSATTRQVRFDDVLTITSMRVSNIVDDSGSLEIEVYAFDANDVVIGCAGSRHGLATVDNAGIEYDTQAVLITPERLAFGSLDAGAAPFRIEVWEDDDTPVCPEPLDTALNDFVGKSPMLTAEQWRTTPLSMFGDVTKLGVAWGRTLEQGEDADPPLLPPDPYSNGGAGCQSTRGGAGALWMVGLCAVLVRRRRLRA